MIEGNDRVVAHIEQLEPGQAWHGGHARQSIVRYIQDPQIYKTLEAVKSGEFVALQVNMGDPAKAFEIVQSREPQPCKADMACVQKRFNDFLMISAFKYCGIHVQSSE